MSWNYRILKQTDDEDNEYYEIKEVYYNRDGSLMGYCDAVVSGESVEDIITVLDMMKADSHKSVLEPKDFKNADNN